MANKHLLTKLINPAIVVLIAVIARLLPHPPNFAPIAALALFGGTYMGRRSAIALPLSAMLISDFFIGFDGLASRVSVYGSFALVGLIGMWLKNHKKWFNVAGAALLSSFLFFTITNFSVWLFSGMYPHSLSGLVEAYILAIPFYRNTILGDLFYTGAFFGGWEGVVALSKKKKLAIQT